ncbi:MAG: hypothetical protein SF053_04420 [Bacteroidia bacterium]|nr:hypothetical protein [Bacteroidia bacterium]
MQLIYEIIRKLTQAEIRQVRHQIDSASFSYDKVGKLFELVTRYEEQGEDFYAQKLYEADADNTFRVTKSRLKRLLENIILHDKSLTAYPPLVNARLQARKKLLQGEILLGRGAYAAGRHLLLQVSAQAHQYDLHEEYFQAEMLLYRNMSIRTSVKDYARHTEQLLAANRTSSLIHEAIILQHHISNLLLHKTLKEEEMAAVEAKVERIAAIAQETMHPAAQTAWYLSANYFHQTNGQYETARSFCLRYLELLETHAVSPSAQALAGAHVQLAKIGLQLGNIPAARTHADEALKRYQPDEMNYLVALELAFRLAFYAGLYPDALNCIQQAIRHPQFSASKLLAARWHYFHACVLFRLSRYKEAYGNLDLLAPLLADKYGMNITIRLLEIMILCEQGHMDLLESRILNMRQYLKRTQQKKGLVRPNALIQILMSWYKHHYDFRQTVIDIQTRLDKLEHHHTTTPFDTSDFELIRLEQWLQDKAGARD